MCLIIVVATGQVIILTAADQRVLPITSVELIGTTASLQQIVTCVTIEMIGAGIAIQHIVAPLSTDSVIAIIPMNEVVRGVARSEEHTSELQSLMRISYAVFCLTQKNTNKAI